MKFTGERFVPGTAGRMKLEHMQRYALCRGLVRGKRVLDIATGEGYGAALLGASASRVIGVDLAPDAIAHAHAKYRAANLQFVVGACEAIPLADGSIDVIVSFETIEHLLDHDAMMGEFQRVLAPDGLVIISSPEKQAYAERRTPNPFHRRELTLCEFEALLRAHFSAVRLWGQRVAVGCFSYPLSAPGSTGANFAAMTISGDELRDAVAVLPSPEYCVAICANGDLPDIRLDSVSLEPDDDFYATLAKTIRAYEATVQGMNEEMLEVRDSFGAQLAASRAASEALQHEFNLTLKAKDILIDELIDEQQAASDALQHEFNLTLKAKDILIDEQQAASDALQHEFNATLKAKDILIAEQQALIETVYRSRSWRLTAPLRDARRMAGWMKHLAATRVERVLRSAYRRLPVASHHRWHIKSAVFRRTGWLMRGTASYQHWQATERRALGNSGGSLVQRLRSDTAAPQPSSAAVLGRSDCVGNRSGVRADGMHATLPGLHRPPRADDTHRGHRRRRCVAGTDGRRARTNRADC